MWYRARERGGAGRDLVDPQTPGGVLLRATSSNRPAWGLERHNIQAGGVASVISTPPLVTCHKKTTGRVRQRAPQKRKGARRRPVRTRFSGGGRRWVPGRRDKKKRKEKKGSPSNKELTPHTSHAPHFFFQTSDTRWRRFQGPSARRRLAVSAGRRAREWRARHALAGMGSWGGGSRPPARVPSRGGQRQVWRREGRSRTPRAWGHALAAGAFQIRLLSALCGRNAECPHSAFLGGGRAEVGPGPQGQEKKKTKKRKPQQ